MDNPGFDPKQVTQFPVINPAEADRFLSIFDAYAGMFTFQTFNDDKKQDRPWLARILHGARETVHAELVDLNRKGAGVFVTINETNFRGRETDRIVKVRAYAFDTDGAPLANGNRLGLLPTVIVESSPGRYWVVYLIIDAPLDKETFKRTQKQLAQLVEGDESVCDLPRVMRLPGFVHQKDPNKPFMVQIVHFRPDIKYTEAEFQAALAAALVKYPPPKPIRTERSQGSPPADDSLTGAMLGGLKDAPEETPEEIAKLWHVLNYVGPDGKRVFDPDCSEEQWKHVLMAIASTGFSCAVDIADQWSVQAKHRYPARGRDDIAEHITRFAKAGRSKRTERSLYADAIDAGWEEPPLEEMLASAAAGLIKPQTVVQPQTTAQYSVFNRPNRRSVFFDGETEQTAQSSLFTGQPNASPDILAGLWWHGSGTAAQLLSWLIKNVLPETGVALIPGQWGTGKTFVALDLANSVARGRDFANRVCKRQGGVLYIAAEGAAFLPIRLKHSVSWISARPRLPECSTGTRCRWC